MPIVVIHSPVDQLVQMGVNRGQYAADQQGFENGLQSAHLGLAQQQASLAQQQAAMQYQHQVAQYRLQQQQQDDARAYRDAELGQQQQALDQRARDADANRQAANDRVDQQVQARRDVAGINNEGATARNQYRTDTARDTADANRDQRYYNTDTRAEVDYAGQDQRAQSTQDKLDAQSAIPRPDYAANEELRGRQAQYHADVDQFRAKDQALAADVASDEHAIKIDRTILQATPYSAEGKAALADLKVRQSTLAQKYQALAAHRNSPPTLQAPTTRPATSRPSAAAVSGGTDQAVGQQAAQFTPGYGGDPHEPPTPPSMTQLEDAAFVPPTWLDQQDPPAHAGGVGIRQRQAYTQWDQAVGQQADGWHAPMARGATGSPFDGGAVMADPQDEANPGPGPMVAAPKYSPQLVDWIAQQKARGVPPAQIKAMLLQMQGR